MEGEKENIRLCQCNIMCSEMEVRKKFTGRRIEQRAKKFAFPALVLFRLVYCSLPSLFAYPFGIH